MSGVVIVHPEKGIYLGNCLGLGFWSLLDAAGQDRAVTFVPVDSAEYASVAELVSAGFWGPWWQM